MDAVSSQPLPRPAVTQPRGRESSVSDSHTGAGGSGSEQDGFSGTDVPSTGRKEARSRAGCDGGLQMQPLDRAACSLLSLPACFQETRVWLDVCLQDACLDHESTKMPNK